MQNERDVFNRRRGVHQHLRERPGDHSDDFPIARIGNRFHIANYTHDREPRAISIESSPTDAFPDRRIVRPKTLRDALADNADERRVRCIARVKIAALQEWLAHALEIARHGNARVGRIHSARLGCGRAFCVEKHQRPRRIHWRWRHDGGGFDSGQCLQLSERSFERALFRRGGGEESIGNSDIKGEAVFRLEAPWLVDELPEILRCGDARRQERSGNRELDHNERTQQPSRTAIECCAT